MLQSMMHPVARWILVMCPKVFSGRTPDHQETPLASNSDPICWGLLTGVTLVRAYLTYTFYP